MTHPIFQKEYFDIYDFYVDSEEKLRENPFVTKITTGFRYEGGKKPIWVVVSALPSEEEALSLLDDTTTLETLNELLYEVEKENLVEGRVLTYLIRKKIHEIEEKGMNRMISDLPRRRELRK